MGDDAQLIALLLAGDASVIGQVRGWIGAAIGRYRGRLGAEAEDLEQEVMLDLMEALAGGRFRRESSRALPGPAGAGSGTIMSYCHLVRSSYSDISLNFGTGHPFGAQPGARRRG